MIMRVMMMTAKVMMTRRREQALDEARCRHTQGAARAHAHSPVAMAAAHSPSLLT